jgi:dienelactone hydrolase
LNQTAEQEITFKTEDGWTIHGVLSLPKAGAEFGRIPAVILLHAPMHDSEIFGHNGYPSVRAALEKETIATLRIDIRGRGKSADPRGYHTFTLEERARVAFDISAAISFLGRQPSIDPSRIGLVAEGATANPAVKAAATNRGVRGLAMLSGRMDQAAKDQIAARDDLPVLCVVSKEDRVGFVDMSDAFRLSRNSVSDLLVYRDIGVGNSMFITWKAKFPNDKPLELTVAAWLTARVNQPAESREISFRTEDNWTIYGSLRVPRSADPQGVPGVVLVHSNLSDRHIYDDLERMLAEAGLAVLNIDFRGRGKSHEKGYYFALPQEERDKAYIDVRAAIDFLAMQKGVNADRLAVVGTAIGSRYALKAANSSPRVKAFVMLAGLPDRAEIEKSSFPILFVSSLGVPPIAEAFREFYKLTRDRGSYLVEHEGGALGYQIFEIDDKLQPLILRWLKPRLTLKKD